MHEYEKAESEDEIEKIDIKRKVSEKRIIKKITLSDKAQYQNNMEQTDAQLALEKVNELYRLGLDDKGIKGMLKRSRTIQESTTVLTEAYNLELTSIDDTITEIIVVKKEIIYKEDGETMRLVEFIPKDFAASADQLEFSIKPVILEKDPVVAFDLDGENTLYYWTEKKTETGMMGIRTVLLAMEHAAEEESNLITGMATDFSGTRISVITIAGIMVILGLLGYYLFGAKPQTDTQFYTGSNSTKDRSTHKKSAPED